MEVAIIIVGAIGLLGLFKILVTLAVFESHKNRGQYNNEEERDFIIVECMKTLAIFHNY
jgi:hypothetical protein